MRGWTVPALLVAAALLLAGLALRPPQLAMADSAPNVFAAERAMADVRAIARQPHPMGSPEASRVQDYLLGRMTALGLSPQVLPFSSAKGPGRNLLGVLPGRDPSLPAVLLMAHADSTPAGPGAADDAAGVAALLETARALKANEDRERDVMVLITDGEEKGLLGAHAFFNAEPARKRVGVVINLEARGNRGRAVMFETHEDAAPLIAMLTDANALAAASSLMPDLYRRLPNDTDLTEAIKHGYQGLNFAFFAGLDAYHGAGDTPDRLDPGSLQHIGEQAFRAALALAQSRTLPGRAPDQPYADLVGGPVLQYPPAAGWALTALALTGLSAYALQVGRQGRLSLRGVAASVGAFALLILVLAAAMWALGETRWAMAGGHAAPLLRRPHATLAGVGLLGGGLAMVWFAVATRWLKPSSLQIGALALVGATAVLLQAIAPLDAFIPIWPLVAVVIGLVLASPDRPWIASLVTLAALTQVFYWSGLIFDLVGQATPVVLAPFVALAVATLLPALPRAQPRTTLAGGVLAGFGLAVSLMTLQA